MLSGSRVAFFKLYYYYIFFLVTYGVFQYSSSTQGSKAHSDEEGVDRKNGMTRTGSQLRTGAPSAQLCEGRPREASGSLGC